MRSPGGAEERCVQQVTLQPTTGPARASPRHKASPDDLDCWQVGVDMAFKFPVNYMGVCVGQQRRSPGNVGPEKAVGTKEVSRSLTNGCAGDVALWPFATPITEKTTP